jgi:uncharacterized cupredoxin-like copper-binding protein
MQQQERNPMNRHHALAAAALLALPLAAAAHGEGAAHPSHPEARKEQKDWGIAGERGGTTRTIEVTMSDKMRFSPETIEVKQGETVRFVIRNGGKMLHEMVLGTRKQLHEHAAMMAKFPGMEHDEPYMAHVGAGKTGEMVWTFNRAGDFEFACLLPGHYQAGMMGRIRVVPAGPSKV